MSVDRHQVRATAAFYDAAASDYAKRVGTELSPRFETEFDRAILDAAKDAFLLRRGPVLDLGCGPGRVTAYLRRRGVDVVGIDLAKAMLASAGTAHPGVPFACGSLGEIPVRTGCAAGVVSWYSIIHTSPDGLADVFDELRRACQADAEVLIAFQAGDGARVDRENAYATGHTMTSYRHSVSHVALTLRSAGFRVAAPAVREPVLEHETAPQAFLTARPGPS